MSIRLFILFIVYLIPSYAEFNPDSQSRAKLTQDKQFLKLKRSVSKALSGSWCSKEKASLIMDVILSEKPHVCVEIGSFVGYSFLPIAATLKFLKNGKAYAIEPWSNQEATKNFADDDPNLHWWAHVDMAKAHYTFTNMIKEWGLELFSEEINLPSKKAVNRFDAIYFIHFDGNFSEESSLEDVRLFFPKVRIGGYV